jgi:hypothetical protein
MGGGFGEVNEAMLNMGGTSDCQILSLSASIWMFSLVANSGVAIALEISAATNPILLVCMWICSSIDTSPQEIGQAIYSDQ